MNQMTIKPKIMIVDPHFQTLRDLAAFLESDFNLINATESEQAIELVKENSDLAVVIINDDEKELSDRVLLDARPLLPNSSFICYSDDINWVDASEKIKQEKVQSFVGRSTPPEQLKAAVFNGYQLFRIKNQLQDLEKIAITDPVTGLANSRFFQSSLEFQLDQSSKDKFRLSIFIVDIDQFKNFNDNFGYGEGDKLLMAIGERIKKLAPQDTTIFRLGSDEFAFILAHLEGKQDIEVAERLRKGFEQYPFFGPYRRPAYVTISLGIAHSPDHGNQYGDLMSAAKAALQQAKRRGRNQTVVAYFC